MKFKIYSLLAPSIIYSKDVPEPSIRQLVEQMDNTPKTWKSGFNNKFNPDSKPSDYKLHSILNFPENENHHPVNPVPKISADEIPTEFDPRDKWGAMCPSLYTITDQGACASSWAMAGATAFSDRVCIQTNGAINKTFSTQDVLECCHGCVSFQGGCEGGYMPQNWISFMNYGIVTGGDYNSNQGCKPYELQPCEHWDHDTSDQNEPRPDCKSLEPAGKPVCSLQCSNVDYSTDYDSDLVKMGSYFGITSHKVSDIQSELMTNGPMETTMKVYDDFLTYTGGVYYHVSGRQYNYIHTVRLM